MRYESRGVQLDGAARTARMFPEEFMRRVSNGTMPQPCMTFDDHPWIWDREAVRTYVKGPSAYVIGTIYVIGFDGYVKIGWSRDVAQRLAHIGLSLPVTPTVYCRTPGTMQDEGALLRRFKDYRSRGEWFRREGALADWIAGGCKDV